MNNIKFVKIFRIIFVFIAVLYGLSKFSMPAYAIENNSAIEETPIVVEQKSVEYQIIETDMEEPVVENASNEEKKEDKLSSTMPVNELTTSSTDETIDEKVNVEKTNPGNDEVYNSTNVTNNENVSSIKSSPTRGDGDGSYPIADFITAVTIDAPKNDQGEYIIRAGSKYHVIMSFAETYDHQFPNDGKMTYQLPAGFLTDVQEESGTFSINVETSEGTVTVKNNHYTIKDGRITITWSEDENVDKLFAASNAKFFIRFWGSFDGNETIIQYNDNVITPIYYDYTDSSIEMVKKSTPNGNKIDYIISITSEGLNRNINLSDVITGNGVKLNPSSIKITSNEQLNYTLDIDEATNSFILHVDSLIDGQIINITYSALLDEKLASREGDSFIIYADNAAKLVAEKIDEIERKTNDRIVIKPSLQKTGTLQDDGTIKWTISVNVDNKLLIKDIPVIDTIDPNSIGSMWYDGEGLTIYVYDENGNLVGGSPRFILWEDLIDFSNAGWKYIIPDDDNYYRYEIEYTTGYDHQGMDKVLKNDVHFGDNESSASISVHGADDITIEKKATDVDTDNLKITWEIIIHVPGSGLNETNNVLTEFYPNKWTEDGHLIEAIIDGSVSILGLTGNERYKIAYNPTNATITFYKDENNTPGLNGTGFQRDIIITLQTEINEEWLSHSTSSADTSFISHGNTISMGGKSKTSYVDVALPTLEKKGEQVKTVTIDDVTYPIFKYDITYGLIDETSIQFDDIFDTDLFRIYIPEDEYDPYYAAYLVTLGGDTINDPRDPAGGWNNLIRIDYIQTPDGIRFLISPDMLAKKADGSFYKYYKFSYYLIPKNLHRIEYFSE